MLQRYFDEINNENSNSGQKIDLFQIESSDNYIKNYFIELDKSLSYWSNFAKKYHFFEISFYTILMSLFTFFYLPLFITSKSTFIEELIIGIICNSCLTILLLSVLRKMRYLSRIVNFRDIFNIISRYTLENKVFKNINEYLFSYEHHSNR